MTEQPHRQDVEAVQSLLDFHRIARVDALRDATHHYHDQQWHFANSLFQIALRQLEWYRKNRWPMCSIVVSAVNFIHYVHFKSQSHQHFMLSDTADKRWQRVRLHAHDSHLEGFMSLQEFGENYIMLNQWFTQHTKGLVPIAVRDVVLLRMRLHG